MDEYAMIGNKKKILFLSDIHLLQEKAADIYGCNTYHAFTTLIKHVRKNHQDTDTIFLMGDLSQDGTEESYIHLQEVLQPFNSKIYCIPGNHDDKESLIKVFKNSKINLDKVVEINDRVFILLDTVESPHNYGVISKSELSFLQTHLQKYPDKKIIILMHHHPFLVRTSLVDKFILKNNVDFIDTIRNFKNIELIIFGHVHQIVQGRFENWHFMSCPSAGFQFPYGMEKLRIEKRIIGYRWLLIDNNDYISGVINIPLC